MLSKTTLAIALTAILPLASAVGNARVVNNCGFGATAWSVGAAISGPFSLPASGGSYSEPFTVDPTTGGRAIKITIPPDGLYTGAPQTIFSYNLDGGSIWYDLSDVFGDAFAGYKLVEASADSSCPAIEWDNGIPPGGSQVKVCESGADVTLTLCA